MDSNISLSYADDGGAKGANAPPKQTETPARAPAPAPAEEPAVFKPVAPKEEAQPVHEEIEYDDDDVDFDLGNDEPSALMGKEESYGSPGAGNGGYGRSHSKEDG